jgi:hypothetical protein
MSENGYMSYYVCVGAFTLTALLYLFVEDENECNHGEFAALSYINAE